MHVSIARASNSHAPPPVPQERGRKRPVPSTPPDSPQASPRLGVMRESCPELCKHLAHEEKQLRSEVCRTILNVELIQRSKEAKDLMVESQAVKSHADALANGLIARVQAALHATHLMSVQLTTWLGTFTPALSVGGNAGVSAEVQDGMYSNMQQLVQTCSDGLHRMLAFEKERATMHLRCLEEKGGTLDERMAVWARYEAALAENQLHELRKASTRPRARGRTRRERRGDPACDLPRRPRDPATLPPRASPSAAPQTCLNLRSDLLCVAHTLQKNGEHLTTHEDSKQHLTTMF